MSRLCTYSRTVHDLCFNHMEKISYTIFIFSEFIWQYAACYANKIKKFNKKKFIIRKSDKSIRSIIAVTL